MLNFRVMVWGKNHKGLLLFAIIIVSQFIYFALFFPGYQ